MAAAAAVYSSISLSSLAMRLGVGDVAQAEAIAARMLAEGRVAGGGSIDQVDGMVDFGGGGGNTVTGTGLGGLMPAGASPFSSSALAAPPSVSALLAWDASVKSACAAVKDAVDAVARAHPTHPPSGYTPQPPSE